MPIGNNIGEKVKFLSFAKIVQMSAEHQARLSVMPSAALSYAKIVQMSAEHQARLSVLQLYFIVPLNFLVPFFLAKKGTERRQR
jgi:predicted GTPase